MSADAVPLRVRGSAVTVLSGAAALYVARVAAPVVVPVLVSVLLSYTLEPAVTLVMRLKLPRVAAALVVYVVLGFGCAALVRSGADPVNSFLDDLPGLVSSAMQQTQSGQPSAITKIQHAASELEKATTTATPAPAPDVRRVTVVERRFDVRSYLIQASRGAVTTSVDLLVIVLLTFLLLATGDLYKRKAVKLGGKTLEEKKVTLTVIRMIDQQIERYLVARLLISAIVAALTAAGLWAIGLSHALVWGLLAGALNVLPFIGSGVAIALSATAAFLQFHSPGLAATAGGITLLVAIIEANAITPWLTSRAGELNTVAVFAGVLFWGWLWDFWGLVLAVPIMVAVKAAADRIEPLQPIGEILGI